MNKTANAMLPTLRRLTFSALAAVLLTPTSLAGATEFSNWKAQHRAEFQAFANAQDAAFHNFLKQHWASFQAIAPAQQDPTPKPSAPPRVTQENLPEHEVVITRSDKVQQTTPEISQEAHSPPKKQTATSAPDQPISFEFLGRSLEMSAPTGLNAVRVPTADKDGVAEFWRAFARHDVTPLIGEVDDLIAELRLNGWGQLLLLDRISRSLGPDERTATALTWSLALRSGLDVKLGYADNRLALLFRPDQTLYDLPYFSVGGSRYYVFAPQGGRADFARTPLFIYKGNHAQADEPLQMALTGSPTPSSEIAVRELSFEFEHQPYQVVAEYDPTLLEYLDSTPQMDLQSYFVTPPSNRLRASLIEHLAPTVQSMKPERAVNFLLRFVQTAFAYQTDEQHFGRENTLYPLETVAYPYSDCEDRAVLFAWLVHEMLGLEVVALDYPGHVATAVNMSIDGPATLVQVNGEHWVAADPTYINADIGMLPSKYKGISPQIVPVQFTPSTAH